MGLYAAQGLAGGGDALGAGLTFELFSHATRFLGLKARRPRSAPLCVPCRLRPPASHCHAIQPGVSLGRRAQQGP
jgi:hypothetical protein